MEKINLPDGRTLNLPSDLPIETRNTIAEELQRDFGIDINQAGVFERVLDAPKSVLRGATSLLTDVPLGISALTLGVDDERTQALQGLQRYLRTDSVLASDPNLRDKFTTKLAEGAGSFVPFLGAGMLGARLAKEGVVKPATGAFGIPAALAVPTGIAAQADRIDSARAMGEEVGPVAEKLALLGGGAIGTTEILPIAAIFRRIPRNVLKYSDVRDKLKSAALTGTFEGGQEVFASVAQDLVARGLYSDELPIGESLFEEFTIGGIIGAGADLLVNSMNRRSVTLEHLKSREEDARKKLYSIHNDEKFTKAQEQGDLTVFQEKPIVKIPDIEVPENLGPNPDLAVIQNPDTSSAYGTETVILQKSIDNMSVLGNQRLTYALSSTRHILCLQPYAGRVGIGTTTPGAPLSVEGSSFTNDDAIRITRTGETNFGIQPKADGVIDFLANRIDGTSAHGSYNFNTRDGGSTVTRMTITSSGSIGIGTSANHQEPVVIYQDTSDTYTEKDYKYNQTLT